MKVYKTRVYKNEEVRRQIIATYDRLLAEWQVETEERDIPTAYGVTHVVACGDAARPPLVLFHGVGDDSALMWLHNAKALARHFRVYAVDTLGGPGKSRPNEKYNKDFRDEEWIDEVLAGLALGRVHMAGQSHGTYLAQHYAAHRPERVRKLVCIAGTVPVGEYSPMKIMMKIFLPEALFPTRRNTEKLIRKLCGKNHAVFTENALVMAHYRWLLKGFNNMAMRFHNLGRLTDAQVSAIRDKTLYLVGEADPFMILGGKAALVGQKMNARFFPEVGHAINHEIAEEINALMLAYLL